MTLRAPASERHSYRGGTPVVQAEGALEAILLLLMLRFGLDTRVFLGDEPGQRLARQAALVLEVAAGDHLPLRVRGEPAFPAGQQLVELFKSVPQRRHNRAMPIGRQPSGVGQSSSI